MIEKNNKNTRDGFQYPFLKILLEKITENPGKYGRKHKKREGIEGVLEVCWKVREVFHQVVFFGDRNSEDHDQAEQTEQQAAHFAAALQVQAKVIQRHNQQDPDDQRVGDQLIVLDFANV